MPVNSELKATKIIGQRKAFYRQRIPEFRCARKETVDTDILVTSRNGHRKEDNLSKRNCQNQLSHPGLSHTGQECQESLIQGKIHNQQNSNEGLEYS